MYYRNYQHAVDYVRYCNAVVQRMDLDASWNNALGSGLALYSEEEYDNVVWERDLAVIKFIEQFGC